MTDTLVTLKLKNDIYFPNRNETHIVKINFVTAKMTISINFEPSVWSLHVATVFATSLGCKEYCFKIFKTKII